MSKINIPQSKIIELFEQFVSGGHRYIFVESRTTPKLNKGSRTLVPKQTFNEAFGADVAGIIKEAEMVYSIGASYENKVNNQLDREGYIKNFEAQPRKWGTFVNGSKILLEHKGENYFQMFQVTDTAITKECKEVHWFKVMQDGTELELTKEERELLNEFLPPPKEDKSVEEGSYDKFKPIVNDFKLASIRAFRFGGNEYQVKI